MLILKMNLDTIVANYTIEQHLQWTKQIADHIHHLIASNNKSDIKNWWEGHYPGSGPNPYQGLTSQGIILQEYYGMPSYIHTPIGRWSILGSGSGNYKELIDQLKEDLSLVLLRKECNTELGIIGPYWKITKWNNISLPKPDWRSESVTYEDSKRIYGDFIKKKSDSINDN